MLVTAALVCAACSGASGKLECEPGPVVAESGLRFEDLVCGREPRASGGDTVTLDYTARVAGGRVFDSSRERGEPLAARLGTTPLIAGFERGVRGMGTGGTRRLVVPPELGYGDEGMAPDVPPHATLVFVVELLSVEEHD